MITALDTNIIVALCDPDEALNLEVQSALDAALGQGRLIISPCGQVWRVPTPPIRILRENSQPSQEVFSEI